MSYSPHKDDGINLILLSPALYAMIYNRISNELDRPKSQDYENAYRMDGIKATYQQPKT